MAKVDVLVEVSTTRPEAFAAFSAAMDSEREALRQGEDIVSNLTGMGLEVMGQYAPVPIFSPATINAAGAMGFAAFESSEENPDRAAQSQVVAAQVELSHLDALRKKKGVTVYANSPLALFCNCGGATAPAPDAPEARIEELTEDDIHLFDMATSAAGIDCRPFRPAATINQLRILLGVRRIWFDGFRGQNIVVGIIDEGVSREFYPVIGGFTRPNLPQPGSAAVTSHGSMCAADVLVAAPAVKLYDYPFLNRTLPRSIDALVMFTEVLDQRRRDGTPHLTNNSYGFVGRPDRADFPNHEIYDINHPLHRKVREVVASGCPCFFAAGNCGRDCPSGNCHPSGIGPGLSIHASNSLKEVITVAAVNRRHERIGYSSQGPGNFEDGFERQKPDVAAYSHFFGNFGPGRPAGAAGTPFDNGTSAATPVATGVAALLMSAFPTLTPPQLKQVLMDSAINIGPPGWDADTGFGVINAAAAYHRLRLG